MFRDLTKTFVIVGVLVGCIGCLLAGQRNGALAQDRLERFTYEPYVNCVAASTSLSPYFEIAGVLFEETEFGPRGDQSLVVVRRVQRDATGQRTMIKDLRSGTLTVDRVNNRASVTFSDGVLEYEYREGSVTVDGAMTIANERHPLQCTLGWDGLPAATIRN